VIPLRSLYVTAVSLVLLGFWLRVARSPLPQAEAAQLSLPAASRPATAAAGALAPSGYAVIVATNVFSQMRAPPSVRFSPAGVAGRAAVAPAKPRGPTLRLYGVTVGPQGAVALIDADPKIPGAEIYRVGDVVAGASLVAITDSTVTLAEPSGPLILRLQPAQRRKP